jgi:tetratricopeptide (TPR) repeat protein
MSDPNADKRRKYPRIRVPKGMFVGWRSPRQHTVSSAREMGLGGIFLSTPQPADLGSTVELIFDVPSGEVRARCTVRYVSPGSGMGLQFVQMRSDHRERLSRYLRMQEAPPAAASADSPADRVAAAKPRTAPPPTQVPSPAAAEPVAPPAAPTFASELTQLLEVAQKGTYYELLDVTADSESGQIKKRFYFLAQKFHPDHHMASGDLQQSLQKLMEAVTRAYKTLTDDQERAVYDKQLAASQAFRMRRDKTEGQETIHECLIRANACIGARNFVGSIVWLRKCVAIAPSDAKYHAMLARSLSTVSQYRNEALQEFESSIELDPWNVKVLFQYAEVCEAMRLFTRARDLYSKILELDPTHAKSLERLAHLDPNAKVPESSSVFARMFGKKH